MHQRETINRHRKVALEGLIPQVNIQRCQRLASTVDNLAKLCLDDAHGFFDAFRLTTDRRRTAPDIVRAIQSPDEPLFDSSQRLKGSLGPAQPRGRGRGALHPRNDGSAAVAPECAMPRPAWERAMTKLPTCASRFLRAVASASRARLNVVALVPLGLDHDRASRERKVRRELHDDVADFGAQAKAGGVAGGLAEVAVAAEMVLSELRTASSNRRPPLAVRSSPRRRAFMRWDQFGTSSPWLVCDLSRRTGRGPLRASRASAPVA